jgi:HEAT repeat protein
VRALADADSLVSHLASHALIAIGEAAVPALLEFCRLTPSAPVPVEVQTARLNAMRALAAIADPRAIPAMLDALVEDSALMQYWAETGLERLGQDMVYIKMD